MTAMESNTAVARAGITRRRFLAGSLAAVALPGCVTSSGERPGILDTHTHFYDPTRPEGVPWPPENDTFLHRPVLPAEFKELVERFGVQGTVVVEASSRIEDNQWLLNLADQEPFIRGVVGHLKPGRSGFAEDLSRFSAHPLFRGIRTGLWSVSIKADEPDFVRDIRRLGERDLALDVLIGPDQLNVIAELASSAPSTRIVIDHCANVSVSEQTSVWARGVHAAALQPNVYMKVSGLVEGSGRQHAPADVEFYRPVLDTIFDAFGEDRILYGSNWPVSARAAAYETVLRIVYDYFKVKGPAVVRKYFWANAARFYALPNTA